MMTLGALLYLVSAMLFATGTVWSVIAGLALQTVASTVLEVTLNLYVLDHVPRRRIGSFEPKRMLYSGMAFIIGPWLGVYLDESVKENLTFVLVGLTALMFLVVFWLLRITDNPAVAAMVKTPPRPTRYLARFARQPRLVLAWVLAVGRNGWWVMFFIYVPIFVTQSGYSEQVSGALVSLGVLPMVLVRYWGRVGQRIGIRRLLFWGYALEGIVTIAAGLAAGLPEATMALLWGAAFMGTVIDAPGNVPFLRAVHPHERSEMMSIFATYRHGATLALPALFAAILAVAPLSFVFIAGGAVSLVMAWLTRYLPKKF
jgi:MFS family permease